MIIFSDLKVFWNKYIDTVEFISREQSRVFINNPLRYLGDEKNREKHYELSALYRNLIFLAVGYVESYLYNLFCTIRETDVEGKDKVSTIINRDMIQDTQIIEDVLLVVFPELVEEISELYEKYKIILNHRDRYVHVSPLIDKSNNSPHLKPVLDINGGRLAEFLQTSIDLVIKIDRNLPKELQLLFWWYNDEINFHDFKKLGLTYKKARINNMDYYSS